jgi:hypothetical protein
MINITKELSDIHKNLSKRKSWMSSLRYSWRSYKRWLNRIYRMNSSNIKKPQIKNEKTQKQVNSERTSTNTKVKQETIKRRYRT